MNSLLIFFGICGLCMCLAAGAGAAPTTTDIIVKAEMEESTTPVPTATLQDSSDNKCDTEWTEYKQKYQKDYQSSGDEEKRQKIFCQNLSEIEKHNAAYDLGQETYKKGVNEFSDLTQDEWQKTYLNMN
ncbi:protein CTLA-2-beta [Drosophila novamexicana]|uniref:protein CTLA-2-beta n=1 Tax=Drosophila novamexicana TaxID=47314 RepID=UPI0011E604AA|nr:protein CTLA-2-beta [Drosophila novamexicana]